MKVIITFLVLLFMLLSCASFERDAYLNLGYLYLIDGKIKDAKTNFEKALEIDENKGILYFYLGWINFVEGNENKSLDLFQKGVDADDVPSEEEQKFILGGLLNHTLRHPDKKETYAKIKNIIILATSKIYDEYKEYFTEDADFSEINRKIITALSNNPSEDVVEEYVELLTLLSTNKKYLDHIEKQSETKKEIFALLIGFAENHHEVVPSMLLLLDSYDDVKQTVELLTYSLEQHSDNLNETKFLIVLNDVCRKDDFIKYLKEKKDKKERLGKAFKLFANTETDLNIFIGGLLIDVKIYNTAEELLKNYIELNPDDPFGYNNLSWLYSTADDKLFQKRVKALELAKKAATLSERKSAAILDTLAEAYYVNGLYKKAVETELEALKLADTHELADQFRDSLKRYNKAYQKFGDRAFLEI